MTPSYGGPDYNCVPASSCVAELGPAASQTCKFPFKYQGRNFSGSLPSLPSLLASNEQFQGKLTSSALHWQGKTTRQEAQLFLTWPNHPNITSTLPCLLSDWNCFREMKSLSGNFPGKGWCSTLRDINGLHITGPYPDPWVGVGVLERLNIFVFIMLLFRDTSGSVERVAWSSNIASILYYVIYLFYPES